MKVPHAISSLRSPWFIAFGAAAVAQLVPVVVRLPQFTVVIGWAIAPLLAIWVWRARGPRLLIVALVVSFVSDVTGNPRLIGLGPSAGAIFISAAALLIADILFVIVVVRCELGRGRRWAALGVIVLLASQVLITLEVTGHIAGTATWYRLTVLTLHALALLLIAVGTVIRAPRRLAVPQPQ